MFHAAVELSVFIEFMQLNWLESRGSYMSAHVLLNLSNELGKSDKM